MAKMHEHKTKEKREDERPLKDCVFVFTGESQLSREELTEKAVSAGARVTSALSGKTTHLVAGEAAGLVKMERARQLGVSILNEAEFLRKLESESEPVLMNGITLSEDTEGAEPPKRIRNTPANPPPSKDPLQTPRSDPQRPATPSLCTPSPASPLPYKNEFPSTHKYESWAEKYRPQKREDLIGNPQAIAQLAAFLRGTDTPRAALLSGPPGIGKTTAAHVLAREAHRLIVEFNASDTRSKSALTEALSGALNTAPLCINAQGPASPPRGRVIIMDEVDGMSSDRGGLPELAAFIKRQSASHSNNLVICICNDSTHPKIRTLASHCLTITFRRPDSRSFLPRLHHILSKERLQLSDAALNILLLRANGDLRFILNGLQSLASQATPSAIASGLTGSFKKDAPPSLFSLAALLFQPLSSAKKLDAYFQEPSMLPLFVHENGLKALPGSSSAETVFKALAAFTEALSAAAAIEARMIGPEQEWQLMPLHGLLSCVVPTRGARLSARLDFPSLLGQESRQQRVLREMALLGSGGRFRMGAQAFREAAAEVVTRRLLEALGRGAAGEACAVLEEAGFGRGDAVALMSVVDAEGYRRVPARVKAAFSKAAGKLPEILGDP